MKIIIIIYCYIILISCVYAQDIKRPIQKTNKAIVYYFGFEIERISGIPETQIQEYGCLYSAEKNEVVRSLSNIKYSNKYRYNSKDVRASILIDDSIYYIDRNGIVKKDNKFFIINKTMFIRSLILEGNCK